MARGGRQTLATIHRERLNQECTAPNDVSAGISINVLGWVSNEFKLDLFDIRWGPISMNILMKSPGLMLNHILKPCIGRQICPYAGWGNNSYSTNNSGRSSQCGDYVLLPTKNLDINIFEINHMERALEWYIGERTTISGQCNTPTSWDRWRAAVDILIINW